MHLQLRVRIEVFLASLGACLVGLFLAVPQWIEVLTGRGADDGSGGFEWLIATGFLTAVMTMPPLVRRARRHRDAQRPAVDRRGDGSSTRNPVVAKMRHAASCAGDAVARNARGYG